MYIYLAYLQSQFINIEFAGYYIYNLCWIMINNETLNNIKLVVHERV